MDVTLVTGVDQLPVVQPGEVKSIEVTRERGKDTGNYDSVTIGLAKDYMRVPKKDDGSGILFDFSVERYFFGKKDPAGVKRIQYSDSLVIRKYGMGPLPRQEKIMVMKTLTGVSKKSGREWSMDVDAAPSINIPVKKAGSFVQSILDFLQLYVDGVANLDLPGSASVDALNQDVPVDDGTVRSRKSKKSE